MTGELSQSQRTGALQAMRDGRAQVCIATDVAARGIDLPNLELVIHADLPKNKESLLHRSGRTGRAGRKGTCALMVPHSARRRTEMLLQRANVKATWSKPPSIDEILNRDQERIHEEPMLIEPLNDDEIFLINLKYNRLPGSKVAPSGSKTPVFMSISLATAFIISGLN